MAYVKLKNVTLDYPIFNTKSHSIRQKFFQAVGGKVSHYNQAKIVRALKNISFEINNGDRLAILGHNGAGKSTILKVISDIYKPTNGSVEVKGKVSSLTNIQLGMEFEATGYENIIMRGIFMGMTFKLIKSKIDEIIEFSELGEYINLPMRTYSSGMALRLAFSVSTCITPEILILDEMIGAGDRNFLHKVERRTKELMKNAKILVLASHNNNIIRKFCNKAIVMGKGEIIAHGNVDDMIKFHNESSSKNK
ncbi:MAG: ABC transporter ATP-binding protein [Rickettsiales bacterium]